MKSFTAGVTLNSQGSAGMPIASAAPAEMIGTLNSEASDLIAITELDGTIA